MTIDQVRAYWEARPCNIRHSKVDIDKDPLVYSKQVTARKRFVEPHTVRFVEFYRWHGKRVLELGCGIGTDALEFARYGASVHAIDISEKSVEIARKRGRVEHLSGFIKFTVDDIEQMGYGFDKEYYDLAYSFGAIHHTPHPFMAMEAAYYYLAPGGTFKLMLYHRKSTKVLRILVTNLGKLLQYIVSFENNCIDQVVALESEAQTGCPITYTFTRKKARQMLESAGFTIQEMTVEHIFPYVVEYYKEGQYIKAFPWNIMPRRLFKWLEHQIGWHLCITATKQ